MSATPSAVKHKNARRVALGISADVGIEHIGSAAVPGLVAKPIIDMMLGGGLERSLHTIQSQLVMRIWEKPAFPVGSTFA